MKESNPKEIITPLTKQFGVKYPIICAPMFLVSSVKLVVSVCEAGGIGTFPALNFRPVERFREALREIKAKTDKPFGVNIIVQKSNKYQHKQIDFVVDERVPLIITSLGNPQKVIELAHQEGLKVYCDVVGYKHAKKVADLGADGVIAVGCGAGGHAGTISHLALIPDLTSRLDIPVVAAGSIVNGSGMAAAFSLGAAAVYMGTRFIASEEAEVDAEYKQAIIDAGYDDIVNTDRVDGFPGNFIHTAALDRLGLQNSLLEEIVSRSQKIKRWISLSRAARSLLANPNGKASYKTIYSAGQGSGLIDAVLPVHKIIENTVREYLEIKHRLP